MPRRIRYYHPKTPEWLKNEYERLGNIRALSGAYGGVNERYLWEWLVKGVKPPKWIRHKMKPAWVGQAVANLERLLRKKGKG